MSDHLFPMRRTRRDFLAATTFGTTEVASASIVPTGVVVLEDSACTRSVVFMLPVTKI